MTSNKWNPQESVLRLILLDVFIRDLNDVYTIFSEFVDEGKLGE